MTAALWVAGGTWRFGYGAAMVAAPMSLADSRRRLLLDSLAIAASGIGFGLVYGLSARAAGFSALEAGAMSAIVFAGRRDPELGLP